MKPGYKQTEVGYIPEDWNLKLIEEVASITRLAGAEYSSVWVEDENGEIIALRGFNIGENKIIEKDVVRISNSLSLRLNRSRLYKGDVVYPCVGTICNAAVIEEDDKYHIQQNIAKITPRKSLSPHYLAYYLMSFLGFREVLRFNATSSQPNVLVGSLRKYRVPLPPSIKEQNAIAATLSDVDALISGLDQLITKKRCLKQAAMQQLLTGKQRLSGFCQKPGYKQTEVGVIPEDWEVEALCDIFNISGGFSASRDQLTSEGHCYLHYGDIHTSTKNFIDVRAEYLDIPKLNIPLKRISSKSLLSDGDIVFVDASEDDEGTSKHVVIINPEGVPYISGLHTIVAKGKTASLDNGYKRYCFQTSDVKRQFYFYAVGTKVNGISKTNIKKVFIPLPPLFEQTAIATVLTDMDAEIAALEQRRDKTRDLKQGMMQELLTGRIRLV